MQVYQPEGQCALRISTHREEAVYGGPVETREPYFRDYMSVVFQSIFNKITNLVAGVNSYTKGNGVMTKI